MWWSCHNVYAYQIIKLYALKYTILNCQIYLKKKKKLLLKNTRLDEKEDIGSCILLFRMTVPGEAADVLRELRAALRRDGHGKLPTVRTNKEQHV